MLSLGEIPRGLVAMWSGAVADIPGGWALCDGQNGTPDLRGRFVTGAGGSYNPGNTGGSADAVVVAHNHGGATGTGGSHKHRSPFRGGNYDSSLSTLWTSAWGTTGAGSGKVVTGTSGSFPRYHPYVEPDGNHNLPIATDGESGAGKNLPPYLALAYIMKL